MYEETRILMLSKSLTIWLDADIAVLADRVSRKDNRPLLKGKDARAVLSELAAIRNPIYALAPVHVKSQSLPHEATVDSILKALQ